VMGAGESLMNNAGAAKQQIEDFLHQVKNG
jgi:UDP-N-acetylenolpyruvoylglucosamine reductase